MGNSPKEEYYECVRNMSFEDVALVESKSPTKEQEKKIAGSFKFRRARELYLQTIHHTFLPA